MMNLVKRSFTDFRASYSKLLLFQYLFMLFTSMILIPVITYIFNRILIVIGSGSLLNSEVYQLGTNVEHVPGLILIGLICSYTLFVQLCVLIIMVQQHYFGKSITIIDAMMTTLIKSTRLIGIGFIQFMFFLLILIPFIDSPLSRSFYSLFNLPILFQKQVIGASTTMTFFYILIVIILLYTFLRLVFVLHFMMLEGKSVTEAIRNSTQLTRGRRLRLFITLFVFNGVFIGGAFLLFNILSYSPIWLNIDILKTFSSHHSLTLSTILTSLLTLLVIPLNIIFLTRLFYYYSYLEGNKPTDQAYIYHSKIGKLELRISTFLSRVTRTRLLYGSVAIIYVSLALYIGFKATDSLVFAKWNVVISAHRGDFKEAPENSLPSIISAIDKGYTSVEFDVQLTKDGMVVLHHDRTLERMTGVPLQVADLTYEELGSFVIGYDVNMEPVSIPSLSEVLGAAKGNIKLLIDLKPYGPSEALVEEVVRQVIAFEMENEVYIQSFDQATLRHVRALSPNIKIGQILYFALGNLNELDVDFYTIEKTMLTEQFVKRAHAVGREVWVWTVNSTKNLKEVMKFRVDGIITDYPERAQSLIELDFGDEKRDTET